MDEYRVAAHPVFRGDDEVPRGRNHAYMVGATSTVCGFGLGPMKCFQELLFNERLQSARCSICDRIIRASTR